MTIDHQDQVRTGRPPIRHRAPGLLALVLIAFCARAVALEPSLEPSQYVLDNWQIPEGLPQTSVQAIARTADGYLWVGTQEGLARFDGFRFTVFDTNNEPALPNRYITVLFVDHAGRLWIGTRSGIALFENGVFKPLNDVAELAHAYVRAITEGRGGRMWVGTENGLFELGHRNAFDASSGIVDGRIRALHEDRAGVLWIGTGSGLLRFDGKHFDAVRLAAPHTDTPVTAIHEDPDGTLWMGTGNGALYRGNRGRFGAMAAPGHLGSAVRVLIRDHDGNLWIGTQWRRTREVAQRHVQHAGDQFVRRGRCALAAGRRRGKPVGGQPWGRTTAIARRKIRIRR